MTRCVRVIAEIAVSLGTVWFVALQGNIAHAPTTGSIKSSAPASVEQVQRSSQNVKVRSARNESLGAVHIDCRDKKKLRAVSLLLALTHDPRAVGLDCRG